MSNERLVYLDNNATTRVAPEVVEASAALNVDATTKAELCIMMALRGAAKKSAEEVRDAIVAEVREFWRRSLREESHMFASVRSEVSATIEMR